MLSMRVVTSDLISVRLHVDGPLVRVSVLLPLFPEVTGDVPKHDGLHDGYPLRVKGGDLFKYFKLQDNTKQQDKEAVWVTLFNL